MDLNIMRKHCGFCRKENYIDRPDDYFCEMRHARYSISYPDFKPTNGHCYDIERCPIYKIIKSLE